MLLLPLNSRFDLAFLWVGVAEFLDEVLVDDTGLVNIKSSLALLPEIKMLDHTHLTSLEEARLEVLIERRQSHVKQLRE